ncbi:MAG TPA: M15 family metallopeptidase [Marmoricola sp.]
MSTSQNGFPALASGSRLLHTWVIPAKHGTIKLTLRNGSAGFILAHLALYMAEVVAPWSIVRSKGNWGYAYRPIRGYSSTLSNHSSGTAMDLDAPRHPLGKVGTWTAKQVVKIHKRLAWRLYRGAIRWGGDYHGRKDEMHFEINVSLAVCERVAKRLMRTPRGKRLLKANPGQKAVILS